MRRGLRRSLTLACVILAPALAASAQAAPMLPLSHAGRWITDTSGRVVIVHGINMVYKIRPYYPAAAGFGADDAAFLQRIGFNAVRVGVIWKAVEPQPGVYDDAYVTHIAATVRTLARHRILSLLVPPGHVQRALPGRGGAGLGGAGRRAADDPPARLSRQPRVDAGPPARLRPLLEQQPGPGHVGLQNRYAGAWRHVAARLRSARGVLGYELFNEPFPGTPYATCLAPAGCPEFDAKLTAFNRRVASAIRRADRRTLIWYEPTSSSTSAR